MNIPDNTISAFTNDILNIILFAHIEGDLSRTCWVRLTIRHGGSSVINLGSLGIDRGVEVRLHRDDRFNYRRIESVDEMIKT
jgi:hypothetical protein